MSGTIYAVDGDWYLTGEVTTGATAVPLMASPTWSAKRGITVMADPANTAPVFVGPLGVTVGTGLWLSPGLSITVDICDPSRVYVISAAAQKVRGSGI